MADKITRTVVNGPARVLINEITATKPQQVADILDPKSFESVNFWTDIGVTRLGIKEINDEIHVIFAEVTIERVAQVVPSGPFQLAAVWNTAQEGDETMMLDFRHWPSVTIQPNNKANEDGVPVIFART